ncbi:MAG: class I SAM-dependent methyltransferase [Candidatus Hodarchaeota archaeon]
MKNEILIKNSSASPVRSHEKPKYGLYAPIFLVVVLIIAGLGIGLLILDYFWANPVLSVLGWIITIFGLYHTFVYLGWSFFAISDELTPWKQVFKLIKVDFDQPLEILDVGCGTGRNALKIAKVMKNSKLYGIDLFLGTMIQGNALWRIQRNAELEGVAQRCEFKEGAAQDIPYPNNKFDVVLMGSVLHEIHKGRGEQLKALHEAYRVLKPQGAFLTVEFVTNKFRTKLLFSVFIKLAGFKSREYWINLLHDSKLTNLQVYNASVKGMDLFIAKKPKM